MYVYFIRQGARGLVKIGRTRNVKLRLQFLQMHNAGRLRLLRTMEGDARTEALAHWAFKDHRRHGEWFRFHPDMLTWTEADAPPLPKSRQWPKQMVTGKGPERDLLARIMQFLEATGETQTGFGRRVMKDANFIYRLRGGRRLYAATVLKIEAALSPSPPKEKENGESRNRGQPAPAGAVRPKKRRQYGRGKR